MNVTDRIALFLSLLQDLYAADYAKNYPMLLPPRLTAPSGGKKYQRIVVTQQYEKGGNVVEGQQSVYCFIDLKTGDILKAAGWASPAKGARGNIFNENCDVGTRATVHGGGLYR